MHVLRSSHVVGSSGLPEPHDPLAAENRKSLSRKRTAISDSPRWVQGSEQGQTHWHEFRIDPL